MGQIRLLPPTLISRIAAGECIERPASVVKELVENSLDAGAARVDISLLDGGRELIQVSDDGAGMDPEDLVLSVTQHATSKLRDDEDLFNIHTLGFRGEALASIAAVARVRVVSRRREAEVGHELRVEAGQVSGPRPCAAPVGTTVAVQDLFYPVPARRKFLRTNQTEMGHVSEQLARIALAHTGVAFQLRHGERLSHRLDATTDRRQRIGDFFGAELANVLLPVRRVGQGVIIEGLVAPPAESRGSNKWEYVFVNGRHIRDRFVSHAVREAYRSLIDPSRSPVAFLWITIAPEQVDVNVHPTKVEVRWQDSNYIHGQVLAALREKFLGTNLDHRLRPQGSDDEYRARVREAMVDFFRRPAPAPPPHFPPAAAPRSLPAGTESAGATTETTAADLGVHGLLAGAPDVLQHSAAGTAPCPATSSAPRQSPEADLPLGRAAAPTVGGAPRAIQVHNAYLVVETADGVMIVDQHALHERILYEELRQRIAERKLESQRLLLPHVVPVPADRLEALETHADTLARLGVELTAAGPHSVALQAFPVLVMERIDQERFVRDLLDLLAEKGARPDADTLVHDILDMMACKAAVKAGDPLTPEEITALLERAAVAARSSHCPHGRPTTLQFSLRDLERQFHRR